MRLSSDSVNCAGITPDTKALRFQSIWNSLVVGSTSATSVREVIIGIRVSDARTESCAVNGLIPGPSICRLSFTRGWLFTRVPVSVMPAYDWLLANELRTDDLSLHLKAQRKVGVPYTDDMIANAAADAYGQANPDSTQADGLTKRYGDKKAVDDLTFTVRPGLVTGFLGPNGAGKSTTMRMILGLDAPTSGTVTVNGHPYTRSAAPMREVGALIDAKAIHGGRSAYNHLLALAQTNNLPRRRVGEVLELTGLTQVAKKRSGGFSLGMGQRLGIAAVLLGDPQVLMFDEPVNGLDPDGIRWIREFMRRLAGEGRTVFVSSHLMSEMEHTADHLIVIGRGRLIADVSTRELIARSAGGFLKVRTDDPGPLITLLADVGAQVTPDGPDTLHVVGLEGDQVARLAHQAGILLLEVAHQAISLEDAYLQLTDASVEYRGAQA